MQIPMQQQVPQTVITLVGARFVEVPATQPLHHRPMMFNMTNDSYVSIQNATQGGQLLDPISLKEVASQVVAPSRVPLGQINIANGWSTSRLSVYLMFNINCNGREYTEVLTGYTDQADLSFTGQLDPNSFIFINSHIRVADNKAYGANGGQSATTMMSSTNVLRPVAISTANGDVCGQFGLRPTDILTGWQRSLRGNAHVIDYRANMSDATTGNMGLPSNRINHTSSAYLSRILESVNQSRAMMGQFTPNGSEIHNEGFMAGSAATAASAGENEYTSVAVFQMLKERTSYAVAGCFTMSELISAMGNNVNWPNIEAPIPLPKGMGQALMQATHGWGDYSNETNVAHKLAHAIPAIASRYFMTTYQFSAWGSMSMGQHVVNYEHSTQMFNFGQELQQRYIAEMNQWLQTIILPEIMHNEGDQYAIHVDFSIGGTINMSTSLDGRPSMDYAAPNYCDSMSAPTITANEHEVTANGQAVSQMISHVFVDNPSIIY